MSPVTVLARVALGTPFVVLGYGAASEPGGRVALAASLGVPRPELAVRGNGAAMVLGGLALATGIRPRAAALGLVASLVPTTVAGHPYWTMDDPGERAVNRIQVFKNLGLAGGLLAVAAASPQPRDDA
jgi:putative oxidoreductase